MQIPISGISEPITRYRLNLSVKLNSGLALVLNQGLSSEIEEEEKLYQPPLRSKTYMLESILLAII